MYAFPVETDVAKLGNIEHCLVKLRIYKPCATAEPFIVLSRSACTHGLKDMNVNAAIISCNVPLLEVT